MVSCLVRAILRYSNTHRTDVHRSPSDPRRLDFLSRVGEGAEPDFKKTGYLKSRHISGRSAAPTQCLVEDAGDHNAEIPQVDFIFTLDRIARVFRNLPSITIADGPTVWSVLRVLIFFSIGVLAVLMFGTNGR